MLQNIMKNIRWCLKGGLSKSVENPIVKGVKLYVEPTSAAMDVGYSAIQGCTERRKRCSGLEKKKDYKSRKEFANLC